MDFKIKINKDKFYNKNLWSENEIILPLGKGSTSYVFKVKNLKENKFYALKEVKINNFLKNLNEIEIHKNINHKNIVKLKNYYINKNNIYIWMELCNKGELFTFLNENKSLKEKHIKNISLQLLEAVKFIHSKNIIHGDIKLGNIFIQDDLYKLGDFGLSMLDKNNYKNYTFGTPNYLAPEIISDKYYSKKSDIWSLGCVIYSLATGQTPFNSDNINTTLNKILNEGVNFECLNGYSAKFISFLKLFLNKNPLERPSADELLMNSFFIELNELTVSTTDNDLEINQIFKNILVKSNIKKNSVNKNYISKYRSPEYKKKFRNLSIYKTLKNKIYNTKLGDLKIKDNKQIELKILKNNKKLTINNKKNIITLKDLKSQKSKEYPLDHLPSKINTYYTYINGILELIENKKNKQLIKNKMGIFEINQNNLFPYIKSQIKGYFCTIYLKTNKIRLKNSKNIEIVYCDLNSEQLKNFDENSKIRYVLKNTISMLNKLNNIF